MTSKSTHRAFGLLAALATLLPASGPRAEEPSPPIELDDAISAITVYSDQAAVTRSAEIRLAAGRHKVAFDPLPPSAWPATAQVEADGARILAVEVLPQWPAEPGKGEEERFAKQLRLAWELADHGPRYDDLVREAKLLTGLWRQPVRKEGEIGAALLATTQNEPVSRWQAQRLQALAVEAERLRVSARALRRELDEVTRGLAPPPDDGRVRVVATLSLSKSATVTLRATTRVSGPRWVPDYDLHLDPEGGIGRVSINALVSQQTGEDWRGVPLRLSTATPGAAADLPRLTAWYLQEEAPPEPEPAMDYDDEEMAMEAPAPRREKAKKTSARRSRRRAEAPASRPSARGLEALIGTSGGSSSSASVADLLSDADGLSADVGEALSRSSGVAIGRRDSDRNGLRGGGGGPSAQPVRTQPTADEITRLLGPPPTGDPALTPPAIVVPPPTGPTVNWSRFHPANQTGGFDYAMTSAGPVDLPSDGVARRIPLTTLDLPVRFEHRVPAAIEQAAYLYALLEQDGQMPLLSGQARVFQSGDLLGDTTLPMSARGATFEVPLGKDEGVRVERKVIEVADRSGPIGGGESVSRTVNLTLRNLRPDAVKAVITDRIPVTFQDGMKVQMVEEPVPAATRHGNGILRWTIDLAPGADSKITFSYVVKHPRNTALKEGS